MRDRIGAAPALAALALLLLATALDTAAVDVDDIPFDQPAPGGQVVEVEWNVTVARRAPDCFGEKREA
jgi:hypothetical protein